MDVDAYLNNVHYDLFYAVNMSPPWDSRKITAAHSSRYLSLCFIQYTLHGFLQQCNYTVCL